MWLISWFPFTIASFWKQKDPLKTIRFIRRGKINTKNEIRLSAAMLSVIYTEFQTSIRCYFLTHYFYWLNPRKNFDYFNNRLPPLIQSMKHPRLSYFYSMKKMPCIAVDYLFHWYQWNISIKTKSRVCIRDLKKQTSVYHPILK